MLAASAIGYMCVAFPDAQTSYYRVTELWCLSTDVFGIFIKIVASRACLNPIGSFG